MAARATKEREPDPPTQIRELEGALAAGPLPRAIVVRGDERYFRESAIRLVVAAALRAGLEVVRHDTQDPDFSKSSLSSDLSAAPMFAAARLVVVRNASALFVATEDQPEPPMTRAVQAYLASSAVPGALLLDAPGLRADSRVVKAAVQAGGRALALRRLWDRPSAWNSDPRQTELVRWLVERARARKLPLTPDDAVYVAAATGNDLAALDAVLERLAGRGSQGIQELVGWSSAGSPFETVEHLCRGDVGRSVLGLEILFQHGFEEKSGARTLDPDALRSILFGSLRSKLRQGLTGALALERGASLSQAADTLEVSSAPAARAGFEALARARPASAWRAMLHQVIDLERASRRGSRVDAADLVNLALRWRRDERARR